MDNERELERLHDRWLEPTEPKVISSQCNTCGEVITEGDIVLICQNGDIIHEDCKIDWVNENIEFEKRQAY